MPKPKILSGEQMVKVFLGFGFEKIRQKGSHIKLRRFKNGRKQTLVVPLHKELDKGTLRAIIRQSGLSREEFFEIL